MPNITFECERMGEGRLGNGEEGEINACLPNWFCVFYEMNKDT